MADVRDPASLAPALAGAQTVVSAVQGFAARGGGSPRTVDLDGNRNLLEAAEAAGAAHFVLVSVVGAAADHPMDLMRMKYAAEELVKAGRLRWTIVRATAFLELYAELVGAPLLKGRRAVVFGRGDNPNDFVSVDDLARFVELAVVDPALRGRVLEVGGQQLTFNEIVAGFAQHTRRPVRVHHVPRALLRLLAPASRLAQAALVMDTRPDTFDSGPTRAAYPAIPVTTLDQLIERDYPGRRGST